MTIEFLGYSIFDKSIEDCAEQIATEASKNERKCKVFACINPHSYAVAKTDETFTKALKTSDWLVPDGSGIILGSKIMGAGLKERVPGPDVFLATLPKLEKSGASIFFLGSSENTLQRIRDRLEIEHPNLKLAGTLSPPFVPEFSGEQTDEMVAAINAAKPDILWVGLTAPRQEKWLAENRDRLDVNAAGAIGAAFDFYAGTVQRSPKIFQKLGLEWLPRLLQQPRRLWQRMFISAPIFLMDVFREKISGA